MRSTIFIILLFSRQDRFVETTLATTPQAGIQNGLFKKYPGKKVSDDGVLTKELRGERI